jgi:hypothetical protein
MDGLKKPCESTQEVGMAFKLSLGTKFIHGKIKFSKNVMPCFGSNETLHITINIQYILFKLTIYFSQLGLSWALNYLKENNCYYLWAQKI